MTTKVLTSSIISIIYFLFKFIEMRFVTKENKSLKLLVIDTLIVFISSTIALYILEQFNINEIVGNIKFVPSAFTNKPDF